MGRPRKVNTDLPQRLMFRHNSFYYLASFDGKQKWLNFGTNRAAAVAKANRLNESKRQQRMDAAAALGIVNQTMREHVLARDNFACVYCGSKEKLEIDHIVPASKGGATSPKNLVVACEHCNGSKSDKHIPIFIAELHRAAERLIEAQIAAVRDGR